MSKEEEVKEFDLIIRFRSKETQIDLQSHIVNHLLEDKIFSDLHLWHFGTSDRSLLNKFQKENEMLRDEIRVLRRNCESDELALNESKEILAELKEKIKDLREFADKLSEAHVDEWEKQQEVITELKELHESDKRSVGIIVKTAKDEIEKYKEQVDKIRGWVKDHLYEDGCIDCDSIETDKLLEILK